MTLYYCFNGLFDYEYYVEDEEIMRTISEIEGMTIESEAVNFYFKIHQERILEKFNNEAYWSYLSEMRTDIIDDKRLEKYLKTIREENEILEGKGARK